MTVREPAFREEVGMKRGECCDVLQQANMTNFADAQSRERRFPGDELDRFVKDTFLELSGGSIETQGLSNGTKDGFRIPSFAPWRDKRVTGSKQGQAPLPWPLDRLFTRFTEQRIPNTYLVVPAVVIRGARASSDRGERYIDYTASRARGS